MLTRHCSTSSMRSRVKHYLFFWYVTRISNPFTLVVQSCHFFMGGWKSFQKLDRCYPSFDTFAVLHFRHFMLLKTFYCLAALDCQLSDSVYEGLQVGTTRRCQTPCVICISAVLTSNSWINMRAANADGFWWWTSLWLCCCLLSTAPITRLQILDQIFKRPTTLDVPPTTASWCF